MPTNLSRATGDAGQLALTTLEPARTILLIDDQPANLSVLAGHLAAQGFTVLVAEDGESGLERASYTQPALIILDVLLPGIDGIETCRRLKADARTCAIPVLFMTAAPGIEDKLRGFAAGGVDYFSKPVQQAELLARVTVHLKIQEQTQRLQQQAAELAHQQAHLEELVAARTAALTAAAQQMHVVNQIGLKIAAGLEFEPLMQTLYAECQRIGDTDTFYVALYDAATGMLEIPINYKDGARRQFSPRNLWENPGLIGYMVEHQETLYLPDLNNLPPGISMVRQPGLPSRSFVGVPLFLDNGVVGVLSMQSHAPQAYTLDQIAALEMLATQVTIAMQNSRLYAQVRRERDLANALIDNMPGAFFLVNTQGQLARWNKLAEELLGATLTASPAPELQTLVIPEHQSRMRDLFTQVFTAGQAAGEIHVTAQNGSVIPFYLNGACVQIGGEPYMLGIGIDITERQQAERELAQSREQLRNLAEYLQAAREQERAAISREIHDEFGQSLTALKMDIAWLARHLHAPETWPAHIEGMLHLVDNTIQTVRRIATELRPGLLDDLGLVAAIEWQTQDFVRRTELAHTLRLGDHDLDLAPDLATALFRILQEALTNIARHAAATHVEVALDDQPALLTLTVRDNGKGIAPGQEDAAYALGLMGMRERARVWRGDVVIEGVQGQGTTVTVRIPQPAARAHML